MMDLLASSPLLLLFVIIGLGFLLGSVRIAGFSLGPAAVLFTGLFLGALDARLRIPDLVYVLGLVIFVYTIGIQSGPTFFSSFGRRSVRANLFALFAVGLAAGLAVLFGSMFALDGPSMIGVFSGALTNTPALAASIETIRQTLPHGINSADAARFVNAPVVGYGVAYPFGVIGVLVCFYIFGNLRGKWILSEHAPPELPAEREIMARTYVVTNPSTAGKSVAQIFDEYGNPEFVLSRVRRGKTTTLVYGETVLEQGDLVVAVGQAAGLDLAKEMLGEESRREIHTENSEFDFRRVEVSDKNVVGRMIRDLKLQELLDATITRIRRGDVDFVPSGDTVLERGDRVRVLTWAGNVERLRRFFGDSVKTSSEADFLSLSIGIVAGVLLGMIPLPTPGGTTFTLGFAGGPLIAGLVLGRLRRSGPVVWSMPFGVNLSLRQIGLVLFLAGIGTKAGDGLVFTLTHGGWKLMIAGGCITLTVTAAVLVLGVRFLHLSIPAVMGLMSGIQTQPACLAYANEHTASNAPNVWYASVYPASMIAKIILAQVLVGILLRS